jgi:hypothetical protein
MAKTACLVCLISTVSVAATKNVENGLEDVAPWRAHDKTQAIYIL